MDQKIEGGSSSSNNEDQRVVFEVNGKRYEVGEIEPSTTLLQFLRSATPFKSVKLGCGEGNCGACVVVLSRVDPVLKQPETFNANSCLTLLCTLNGYSITTSEGLGNTKDGFHPIHQRFAGFHASQCGFCTPGFCMSLFSALANAAGFSSLTASQAENSITGNLCRCTGYRPIEDACKSFAADVDLEDLGLNSFWKRGEAAAAKLPPFDPELHVAPYVGVALGDESKVLNSEKLSWFTPVSLEELNSLLSSGISKLVVGNTATGYYKEMQYSQFDKYIDLRYIPELSMVGKDSTGIEFGAALPISKVIRSLEEEGESSSIFKNLAQHMERVASNFIRNTASIGGNLVIAQRNFFPSDIATLLLAVGSTLTILRSSTGVQEKISIDDFLYGPPLDLKDVLLSVFVPSGVDDSATFVFESYRASPRPLGNALPYLNAAFLANVGSDESGGGVVNYARLAFGAYGTNHATRATQVEEYLEARILTLETVEEAVRLVKDDVVPEEGTTYPEYRKSLAVSYLFSFLSSLLGAKGDEEESKHPPSEQFIESSEEYYPVGEPLPKTGALLQASGEAVYVDDIPSPPHCLHGALVCSTEALARVKGVSFDSSGLNEACIVDVISAKDIPEGGENIGGISNFDSEPLFAVDVAQFAGDIIAFVVADGQKEANLAARMARVEYDTEGLDTIVTVEEAVQRSSFFDIPPEITPVGVGDFSQGMSEADHQILSEEIILGSQYFFYMETQTALAVPDEDNTMVVYSSIQCPEYAHTVIARCLGVPEHNVRVITRRLGGGFGGKCLRSMNVATACAVAAQKLHRPVRIYVDRNTDMTIAGGRHPMKVTYSVGFKSNGKITALHLDILMNAGIYTDFSPVIPGFTANGLKKYNWGAISFDIKLCKTNTTSKTTMRAPGDTQGNYIAEAIIERVASHLSMDANSVREINLHSYQTLQLFYGEAAGEEAEYTLPSIWDKIVKSQDYIERVGAMQEFNSSNIWHKRGISCVPIVYLVVVNHTSGKVSILKDGSVAVQVGGIEMGQGLWTKVRQATAYALGSITVDDLYEKVRIVQSDTLSLVQQGLTAQSTTSEASCAVVMECCNILVQRLSPIATRLQQETGSVQWDDLVLQAYTESINMQANSYFVPEATASEYLNYGAALSEVEISCLTGEKWILRSDIRYDCGKSLNPAVDLGQIEGSFIQGVGLFITEEYLTNEEGVVTTNSTWDYHIPSRDNISKQLNVEVLNSGNHPNRILSSKACGEPPLLLAATVHCAIRAAVAEARKQLESWGATEGTEPDFELGVPATLPVVKQLCGLNYVETYLQNSLAPPS